MDAVRGLRVVSKEMTRIGWPVTLLPGWETRGQYGPIAPRGAVNHWTGGPRGATAPSLRIVTFGRADLRNALCNTYSSRAPELFVVAACKAWHAGRGAYGDLRGNLDLGHEAESAGWGDWSDDHLEMVRDLDLIQADVFGYDIADIIDHFEWAVPRGRKPDRQDVGGAPWRASLRARSIPTPEPETTWLEELMAAGEQQLKQIADAIGDNTRARGQAAQVRRRQAEVEAARWVAEVRGQYGLAPDPASDVWWAPRLADGRKSVVDVVEALAAKAAGQ